MQTEQIVALLIAERDRLDRAIQALQGPAKRRGRPPRAAAAVAAAPSMGAAAPAPKQRKVRSAAQRKAHSERMKAFWAARRKQTAKKA